MSDKVCVRTRELMKDWIDHGWKCIGLSENGQFVMAVNNGS